MPTSDASQIIFAHSLPGQSLYAWEKLTDHQAAVAKLAYGFASNFGFGAMAQLAGELHDIGKLSPEFQAYIRNERASGGDHSSAGARIALDTYELSANKPSLVGKILAAIIAAHHAGLADGPDLIERLKPIGERLPPGWREWAGVLPPQGALAPTMRFDLNHSPKGFSRSFLIRSLFSCLVDAGA